MRKHQGLAWYPGRVAWFHAGANIGWIPLAPHEPYYSYRRWGPRSVVVKNVTVVNVNVANYRNERHAVMVDRRRLHTADNYRTASIRNVDRRTLGARIQAVPVIAQEKAPRDPGRASSAVRSGETGRTPYADAKGTSRQLPAGPRTGNQNLHNLETLNGSSAVSGRRTRAPAAPAPARAGTNRAMERAAPESGSAVRGLPRPRAQELEQPGREAIRSPNERVQTQRVRPDNSSPGRPENSVRGRSLLR